MNQWQSDVLEFHRIIGAQVALMPIEPAFDIRRKRDLLLREEYDELVEMMFADTGSLDGIAKEVCDVIYTAIGIANAYGIDLAPVWEAVHASNMAKGKQAKPCNGKVPKPKGWQKPVISAILAKQKPLESK